MTTVLEAAREVVAAAPESFYRYDPATGAMNSFCQQFVGLMWEKAKGRETPNNYGSAAAARRDSTSFTTDWRQASPGDIIYLGSNHVGIYEGNGVMISATARSQKALEHLGKSVYRHRVDDYAEMLPPLMISHTNGKRERITEFTSTGTAGGDMTPFPNPTNHESEEDDMKDLLLLIQTPQKKTPTASDWWVQNLADHTYWHVESITQLNYLRALGVREVQGQQAVAVLSGFKRI